jgi:hypothetical protein
VEAPAVFGASVTGDAHIRSGLPCQDAFRILVGEGVIAVAVADGLGSASRSDLGAATASEAAASRALELADRNPVDASLEAMIAAREALEDLASEGECELSDFACTLMVAVVTSRVAIAHIGDGAVVGLSAGEPCVLSPPANAEYVNEVDPLTSKDWVDHVRSVLCTDTVDAIGLFTDGCQHAAVRRDNGHLRAHAGFFRPLFDFARSAVDACEANVALAELLGGRKMSEHSDDDKTLVLAVLR